MIKAVFLDLYGTLARFHPPKEEIQAWACKAFGITVTREGLIRGYAIADELMSNVNAGQTPVTQMEGQERDRFFAVYERLILQGAGVDVDLETARRVWAKGQEIPYGLTLFDDVLPIMDVLKLRGLTLGLLSNIGQDIAKLCEDLGLAPYLDFAVTSREAGSAKPNPPIFRMALERSNVKPAEALHVGDSYSSDVQGARGVGIHPLLLDRESVMDDVNDCPKISSLMEVLEHL